MHDASGQNSFAADEYIRGHHARSVLCLPLLKQTRLLGVLYLENSLTPHAFTSARMAVLKLLASAAAISMENTRLYSDLEDREAKIRRLVDANILGIATWNVDGAILSSNEAFLRMVQYHHEDVAAGRVRWWDMTPADWRERAERALAEVIQTGTVQPFESEFFRKDGTRVPVLIGATLFQEGGHDGVAFVLDLSKQKQAEAEIRALKDQLYRENLALRDEVDRAQMFEEIVGSSKPLKTVLSRIAKVAPTDSTVFITGETGTGKELIARAVHKQSKRAGRAFVSVNCAALALSGDDFNADIAERYGWVNRTLDDDDLDSFVDTLVGRLASFDRETLAAAKAQVNRFGTPTATELQSSNDLFFPLLALPGAQARRAKVRNIGYGVRSDFELNFGRYLPSFGRADDDATDKQPVASKGKADSQ